MVPDENCRNAGIAERLLIREKGTDDGSSVSNSCSYSIMRDYPAGFQDAVDLPHGLIRVTGVHERFHGVDSIKDAAIEV